MKLWAGQTVSEVGSRITREGIPLTAVLVLSASPAQMGFLTAVGAAATLLFGLVAGVWVDRMRRRPMMIACDVARAALLITIPLAALAHHLSMAQLYAVIALTGVCTVFFDVAYQSYLPSLVEPEHLLDGNSKLSISSATAEILGPSVTGVLVQLITAPVAILFDAISFLLSALSVGLIRKPELPHAPAGPAPHLREETIAGLRFIVSHKVLRSLAGFSVCFYFSMGFVGPLYVLYAMRELHLTPAALGIAIATGGAGYLLGSVVAPRVAWKFGLGRTFLGSMLTASCAYCLIPLAHGPMPVALSFLIVSQIIGDMAGAIYFINELTLRQTLAPPEMLGRVNAAMQLAGRGVYPLGAVAGGVLAGAIGIRATLVVAISGILLSISWLIGLRKLKGPADRLPYGRGSE